MNEKVTHVRKVWRRSRFFCLYFFPFWIALIAAINIWGDAQDGKPLNPVNIWAPLGFLAFDGVLLAAMYLIFRFVLGVVSDGRERH